MVYYEAAFYGLRCSLEEAVFLGKSRPAIMKLHFSLVFAALLNVALFGCVVHAQCTDGKCVGIAKCRSNYGAENLFDLRIGAEVEGECNHYLEVCCETNDIIEDNAQTPPPAAAGRASKFTECGHSNPDGAGFRTINGRHNESEFGEFPWMVALLESQMLLDELSQLFICGGSLIAPNVVLTAAHCVHKKDVGSITVRAGEWDTRTENEVLPYQEQKVQSIILQPHYNSAMMFNDVALLVLEQPFQPDDNVQLICLPPQGATFDDKNCYAIGWGKSNFDSDVYQVILKKMQLPIVSHADCQTALRGTRLGGNYRLHNSFLCAGGEAGIDTCTGDGGSPLMCPFRGSDSRFYQAGIVSWGIGCGTAGVPGVYARNSMFTEWINQELQKLGVNNDLFD